MGAGVPLKVMVTPEKVVGYWPLVIGAGTTPETPGSIPKPRMFAIEPGETPVFGSKLAPLMIVILVGAGGSDMRVKLTLKVAVAAVTVIAPAVAPAVTVVEACPEEFVVAEAVPSVAVPEVT